MQLSDIQFIFNRAISLAFDRRKWLLTFIVMALCGVLVVFFRGLAVNANQWLLLSLTFLPIFLCAGVLFSAGIMLTRIYHDEIKKKEISYRDIFTKSWEVIIGASYFSVPIILAYLLMWMLLGIFIMLREIPGLGDVFGVLLSFAPFLLNLGSLLLCCLSMAMLFFLTPVLAFKGINSKQVVAILMHRFQKNIFGNLFLAVIAMVPLLFVLGILFLAVFLTQLICYGCEHPAYTILHWFVIMIPFTALLSPAVVFFFNFAAESHVFMRKESVLK